MKLKKDFVLRQVAGAWVVLPLGEMTVNFDGMLTLNGSGALLWKALEAGGDREALAAALTSEYEVTSQQALEDVDAFVQKLHAAGCLED